MAKLSIADKMRIQTLREQGMGAMTIRNTYPEKRWALSTINKICKRVDSCGSAVDQQLKAKLEVAGRKLRVLL